MRRASVALLLLWTAAATAGLTLSAAAQSPEAEPAVDRPAAVQTPPPGTVTAPPASGVAAEDIRDIRGPKFLLPRWLLPAVIAVLVLLGLAVYGIVRWLRRRRRPRALLPFEVALQRLEDIRPLMQPQSAREFSTAVSDIVRGYIEQRFDVIATHRTTEEFLHDLLQSSNGALVRHRALLAEFLQQCDLVKFAGISLNRQTMEALHGSARAFVLETSKPDPAELGKSTTTGTALPAVAAGTVREGP